MSNNSVIQVSRKLHIDDDKNIALVSLNTHHHKKGQPVIVKYFKDRDTGETDMMIAMGKKDGVGPDCYTLIQSSEECLVKTIGLPCVSQLTNGEKCLCYLESSDNGPEGWYLVYDVPNSDHSIYVRHFDLITEPTIFRNLDDGFRWFYSNEELKREDDFISSANIEEIIINNLDNYLQPSINAHLDIDATESDDKYYLDYGTQSVDSPEFTLNVYNFNNEDITSDCTITVSDVTNVECIEDHRYRIYKQYTNDSEIKINATTPNGSVLSITKHIYFPHEIFYGTTDNSTVITNDIENVQSKIIYLDQNSFSIVYNLENSRSILLTSVDLGTADHIYDIHGLDYLEDYTQRNDFSYNGQTYYAYIKQDRVTIDNFKQTFVYGW